MSTTLSNASTATNGGSAPAIRNGLALRLALAEAIWNALPDGRPHEIPFALLTAVEREEPIAEAKAALAVIAKRVILPKLETLLKQPVNMPGALAVEEIFVSLTGMPPLQFLQEAGE